MKMCNGKFQEFHYTVNITQKIGVFMNKKLWGGRFKKSIDPLFEKFSSSISTDYRLAQCDLIGSFLHIHVLRAAKLLPDQDFLKLKKGIHSLLNDLDRGVFAFDASAEDVHTNIQNLLLKKAGLSALKLQTCRSRNDQVVFATKLYCHIFGNALLELIAGVQDALCGLGRENQNLVMPGYTHMQHAQPIYFKDYAASYASMFESDACRIKDVLSRLDISLGSGALAGTPIPAATYKSAISAGLKALKLQEFQKAISSPKNSLEVVSSRDFVIELLSVLAIMGVHISRLSEDLILWSTKEFGFIEIGDEYCTGSSLMPNKKNPDALELMRGAAGVFNGNLVNMLTVMKGLPLSYNRDMQWDKAPLFSSLELAKDELSILAGLLKVVDVNCENIARQLQDESLCATDLADYLVLQGVAFGEAHEIVGRLIQYSLSADKPIKDMSQAELNKISTKLLKKEVLRRMDPVFCAASKKSVTR